MPQEQRFLDDCVQANPCVNNSLPLMMTAPKSGHNADSATLQAQQPRDRHCKPQLLKPPERVQATKPALHTRQSRGRPRLEARPVYRV